MVALICKAGDKSEAKIEATISAERMIFYAREAEAEAGTGPGASREREEAEDLMSRAIAGSQEIRSEASDALAAGRNGNAEEAAFIREGIAREIGTMHDQIRDEREAVQETPPHHQVEDDGYEFEPGF
ncbi:hypothetical protein [Acidiphilium multivorum]|uniref:hypothetical protein n=1 Tax=Acidiphilium multivorum TaxID=62140 RepID=UPI0009E4ACEE|nr:hypothetical protein [Acidiphilium multivorum]